MSIEQIRAREQAATEGPWKALGTGRSGGDHWYICDDGEAIASISCQDGINEDQREPDAEFISHARQDVPLLLDEVDRLRGELDKAQRACQTLGRIVDQQCEAALNATGSHDLLWGDDGDGDWGAIWERIAELGTHKTAVEAVLAEVAEWDKSAEISDNTANDLHRQRNVEAAGLHVYHAELSRNHAARIRTTITQALEGTK